MNVQKIYVNIMTNNAIPVLAKYGPHIGTISIDALKRIVSYNIQVAIRDINNQNALILTNDIYNKNKDIVKYITDAGYVITDSGKISKIEKVIEKKEEVAAPVVEVKEVIKPTPIEELKKEEVIPEAVVTETPVETEEVTEEVQEETTEVAKDGETPAPTAPRNSNRKRR